MNRSPDPAILLQTPVPINHPLIYEVSTAGFVSLSLSAGTGSGVSTCVCPRSASLKGFENKEASVPNILPTELLGSLTL